MPLRESKCKTCGHVQEYLEPQQECPAVCPRCFQSCERVLFSPSGFKMANEAQRDMEREMCGPNYCPSGVEGF